MFEVERLPNHYGKARPLAGDVAGDTWTILCMLGLAQGLPDSHQTGRRARSAR